MSKQANVQAKKTLNERFTDLADIISEGMGRWWVTALSLLALLLWLALGPFMHWSDSWQLIANTPTTWIELFIGFLIAAAANRVERHHDELLKANLASTKRDEATTKRVEGILAEIKAEIVTLKEARTP